MSHCGLGFWKACTALALLALGVAISTAGWAKSTAAIVEIRRTTDGIPHVRAGTWRGLGMGLGFVQAEDALCTLAEAFVTYRGQRSLYFGAEAKPATRSTFGNPKNLDLDFFFKAFTGQEAVAAFRREQPPELNALIAGYAKGYNRHLRTLHQRKRMAVPKATCANDEWVRPIAPADIYRRMMAAGLAGGYARFVSEIANAQPAASEPPEASDALSLSSKLGISVGDAHGIGSNAMAFGRSVTGERGGVLFGNPHWYWGGPDRFYQAQLTLPGKVNVAGVSFLGIPVIMIGFNNDVAWSHTVSAARRFGFFELTLDPTDATRYLVDGVSEPMGTQSLVVEVRRPDGAVGQVYRTLYRTRFGPMLDLAARNRALGWGVSKAVAIRDINASNARIFRNFLRWNQAASLDAFIDIQKSELAMPWVNTVAIGRGDGRVWYADMGTVPGVSNALRQACATPLAKEFSAIDASTPFLDGSRSSCEWQTGVGAWLPGSMAAGQLPGLLREDYVVNMNDSYWLANPLQPLKGFPSILGGEEKPLSMRSREGHRIAGDVSKEVAGSAQALAIRLMQKTLEARSYTADQYKQSLLDGICTSDESEATHELLQACQVLGSWSNRADAQDRGALLWDAVWSRLQKAPANELYTTAFSATDPLHTPGSLNAKARYVSEALSDAIKSMQSQGLALDAPLGLVRFVRSEGRQLPLYGGCDAQGYFTIACANDGNYTMDARSHGNTYLQIVYFDRNGVQARTLLAHGQQETAVANGGSIRPVSRYANKDWLHFPFRQRDIERDPSLRKRWLLQSSNR